MDKVIQVLHELAERKDLSSDHVEKLKLAIQGLSSNNFFSPVLDDFGGDCKQQRLVTSVDGCFLTITFSDGCGSKDVFE